MSNVKIKANASGTADFTIEAPATDSALTLTLPDTQGTLVTDAAGDIERAFSTQIGGRRNLIINGGFDVWQRGTSFSISGSVPYTADRWKIGGGTSTTVSRQTFTVGQTDVPNNPTYYCRWNITNNSQNYEFTQKIENVGTAAGQSLTISYWAKRNSGSLNPQLQVVQDFGSGGSSTVVTGVATPSLTSSWTKYTYTVSVPSISGKTLGTGHCLYVRWQATTTDTGQIDIANVQAEVGSVATPFEHRSYGEELALCQRYYTSSFSGMTTVGGSLPASAGGRIIAFADSTGSSPNRFAFIHTWTVQMRASPTVVLYGNQWSSGKVSAYNGGTTEWTLTRTPTGSVNGLNPDYLTASGVSAGDFRVAYVTADAEL